MKAKIKSLFLTGFPVALTALLFVVVFAWAWVEPTQAPPNGNVPAPINVGPTGQAKRGNLMLNTDGSWEYGLLIPYGKVGIGTTTPAAKLDVAGNAKIEGDLEVSGKIIGSGLTVCRLAGFDYDTICSIPVKAGDAPCPIWKDCDGDGYTYGNGDCDESCPTCYVGSTKYTTSPDGRDQDCDGVIDEKVISEVARYLNSASGKSCSTVCAEYGKSCLGCELPDPYGGWWGGEYICQLWHTPPDCGEYSCSCGHIMRNSVAECGNCGPSPSTGESHPADWTYCKCANIKYY